MEKGPYSECPLCLEDLNDVEKCFRPCPCGYQMCTFCFNRLKESNKKCPNCKRTYIQSSFSWVDISNTSKASIKKKVKKQNYQLVPNRNLLSIRVVQRNLVYVTNLALSLADEEILRRHEYFGQYGKIIKMSVNRSYVYQGSSVSCYVTYFSPEEASLCIECINGCILNNKTLRASFGTTKYCTYFLKGRSCVNADCMYLHSYGDEKDSFTKEDMQAQKHLERYPPPKPLIETDPEYVKAPRVGLPPPKRSITFPPHISIAQGGNLITQKQVSNEKVSSEEPPKGKSTMTTSSNSNENPIIRRNSGEGSESEFNRKTKNGNKDTFTKKQHYFDSSGKSSMSRRFEGETQDLKNKSIEEENDNGSGDDKGNGKYNNKDRNLFCLVPPGFEWGINSDNYMKNTTGDEMEHLNTAGQKRSETSHSDSLKASDSELANFNENNTSGIYNLKDVQIRPVDRSQHWMIKPLSSDMNDESEEMSPWTFDSSCFDSIKKEGDSIAYKDIYWNDVDDDKNQFLLNINSINGDGGCGNISRNIDTECENAANMDYRLFDLSSSTNRMQFDMGTDSNYSFENVTQLLADNDDNENNKIFLDINNLMDNQNCKIHEYSKQQYEYSGQRYDTMSLLNLLPPFGSIPANGYGNNGDNGLNFDTKFYFDNDKDKNKFADSIPFVYNNQMFMGQQIEQANAGDLHHPAISGYNNGFDSANAPNYGNYLFCDKNEKSNDFYVYGDDGNRMAEDMAFENEYTKRQMEQPTQYIGNKQMSTNPSKYNGMMDASCRMVSLNQSQGMQPNCTNTSPKPSHVGLEPSLYKEDPNPPEVIHLSKILNNKLTPFSRLKKNL